jgi:hypothetical protein
LKVNKDKIHLANKICKYNLNTICCQEFNKVSVYSDFCPNFPPFFALAYPEYKVGNRELQICHFASSSSSELNTTPLLLSFRLD